MMEDAHRVGRGGGARQPAGAAPSTRAIRVVSAALLLGIGAVAACSRGRPSGGGGAGVAGAPGHAPSAALVCPSVGAHSGRAPSEKSSIGSRHEPARVAVMGSRVAHLEENGVALWEGSRRLREDALERPVAVAVGEDAAFTVSRGAGGRVCRHPVRGAPTCDPVEGRFVSDATRLAVDASGAPWLGAPAARLLLGPAGKQVPLLPGSTLLFDGTVVEATPDRVVWSSLGGPRHEVSVGACALRFVSGGSELLLLAGEDHAPGDEGTERWRAVRVDGGGRLTVIGELVGHPYDAAPWMQGVAVLRARRASYGDPVTWDVVLLSPGAVPREERLPMQPRYNLVWDTGFSIAASGAAVAVGDRRRLAVLDVAGGAWVVTE